MMYLNVKPGQMVTVTIKACVRNIDADDMWLDEIDMPIPIRRLGNRAVVSIDGPEHWPPLAGDIWRLFLDPEGHEDWHAIICRDYTGDASASEVQMTDPTDTDADWREPADVLKRGVLRLVWRNGSAVL